MGCQERVNGRTDEGVCPYFVAFIWIERTIQISFREALLPLGEAGRGFQTRVSVPTVWHVLLFSLAASTLSSAPLAHY